MAEAAPIRVASVGLGWVTVNRHIPALRRCSGTDLVGLIDHQPDRAEMTARRQRLPLFASAQTAADVPWLDQIDAVTIGTPPQTHYAVARSYLEAGKHVLVEKPMAMTVEQAKQLADLAEERDLVLAVVHNFQFTASFRRLTELMTSGRLGEIRSIWAVQLSNPKRRLPVWYEDLPLGLFYDESPHFFYLLRRLAANDLVFRSIDVIRSAGGTVTPAKITALLDAHGTPVQIDMNFQAPLSEWHVGVLGTHRAAFVDLFRDILVVVPNDGEHLGRDILRTSAAAGLSHFAGTVRSGILLMTGRLAYGNDEVVRKFSLACRGQRNGLVGISADDGVAVVEMQHQVIANSK